MATVDTAKVKALAKFRMGVYRLSVKIGKYTKVDRSERVCRVYSSNTVEKETQIVVLLLGKVCLVLPCNIHILHSLLHRGL